MVSVSSVIWVLPGEALPPANWELSLLQWGEKSAPPGDAEGNGEDSKSAKQESKPVSHQGPKSSLRVAFTHPASQVPSRSQV